MKRRLLNVLTVLSLLLCATVVGMWSSSDVQPLILRDGGGGFAGGSSTYTYALFLGDTRAGIGWTRSDVWFEGELSAPYWLLLTAGALLPAARLARALRRRPDPGACTTCSYNLTGNVSGVCPECGAARGGV